MTSRSAEQTKVVERLERLERVVEALRVRVDRVETAIAETTYMSNGTHGLASLARQAPTAAALAADWLRATTPRGDTFVGRDPLETTVARTTNERRTK